MNDASELLFILSLMIHLYLSYLLLGGFPILVLTIWLGERKGQVHLKTLAQKMRRSGPTLVVLAISFGFLLGLMVYGKYGTYTNSLLDGFRIGYGLLLLFLILTFWGTVFLKNKDAFFTTNSTIHVTLLGVGTFVCLLGMTFLFVISHIMMLHPEYSKVLVDKGFFASLSLPTLWPRFIHIVLGSVAATGIVIALYGTLRQGQVKEGSKPSDSLFNPFGVQITRYGVGWTLAGTLPQIVVGPWLLIALPDEVRMRLVDGAGVSSLVFFFSLTFALLALVLLNASLMVPQVRGLVWAGLASLFVTIVLMVIVREEVRKAWMQSSQGLNMIGKISSGLIGGLFLTISLGFPVIWPNMGQMVQI